MSVDLLHPDISPAPMANAISAFHASEIRREHLRYDRIISLSDSEFNNTDFASVFDLRAKLFGESARPSDRCRKILGFNGDPEVQALWGQAQYAIIYVRDKQFQTVVGASMFSTMACPPELKEKSGYDATIAADYLFVDTPYQGQGVADRLMTERQACAEKFLASLDQSTPIGRPRTLIFNEFDDPLRLTPAEYKEGTEHCGISPVQRAIVWYNKGYRTFPFAYLEPASDDREQPDRQTTLNVLVAAPSHSIKPEFLDPISTDLIARHLTSHTAICRKVGRDPHSDPSFNQLQERISVCDSHMPIDRRPFLQKIALSIEELLARDLSPTETATPIWQLLGRQNPEEGLEF